MRRQLAQVFSALALSAVAAFLLAAGSSSAHAQTAAQRQVVEMLSRWGLVGDWSLDCSRPPSRDNGYLNYVIQQPGIAMHVRYFGDAKDSHEVLDARPVQGGGLELTVRFAFRDGAQTRRWVLVKEGNRIRAISNVNVETGDASIRNGRFVHNGAETPWQTQCTGGRSSLPQPGLRLAQQAVR